MMLDGLFDEFTLFDDACCRIPVIDDALLTLVTPKVKMKNLRNSTKKHVVDYLISKLRHQK